MPWDLTYIACTDPPSSSPFMGPFVGNTRSLTMDDVGATELGWPKPVTLNASGMSWPRTKDLPRGSRLVDA